MKIKVDGKTYDHDGDRLNVNEAILLQQLTGLSFKQWQNGLGEMDPVALKGLVYLVKVRAGEQPDWTTLDFDLGALDVVEEPVLEVPTGAGAAA